MIFDPQGVQDFLDFDIVDSNEVSIIEFLRVPQTKAEAKEAMMDTASPIRIARVEQLRLLYLEREESEISPFDDKSADLQKFLNDNVPPWEN